MKHAFLGLLATIFVSVCALAQNCDGCRKQEHPVGTNPPTDEWTYTIGALDDNGLCGPVATNCVPYTRPCTWNGEIKFRNTSGAPRAVFAMGVFITTVQDGDAWTCKLNQFWTQCGDKPELTSVNGQGQVTAVFQFECEGCF